MTGRKHFFSAMKCACIHRQAHLFSTRLHVSMARTDPESAFLCRKLHESKKSIKLIEEKVEDVKKKQIRIQSRLQRVRPSDSLIYVHLVSEKRKLDKLFKVYELVLKRRRLTLSEAQFWIKTASPDF